MATILAAVALSGCGPDGVRAAFDRVSGGEQIAGPETGGAAARDIEAPDVFQTTEPGLWDGRPSLGGVWVAHPDVADPERVIIRNRSNGQSVTGALFRRERESSGPKLQVSSDAATALGMLAGQPADLTVVVLRRAGGRMSEASPGVSDEAATSGPVDAPAAQPPGTRPPAAARRAPPSLDRPYIQVGIFGLEQSARDAAGAMRDAGLDPAIRAQTAGAGSIWRVLVGPARSDAERSALLETIKGEGFRDAYAVAE
ncbi:SPOR domain-containing protein [Roseivivax halodurans]|nr:SPOR domain-containing protein [Roseivivax halodurans]